MNLWINWKSKNAVFWDVAPCRSCMNGRRIPENGILHSHRRENLKSYKIENRFRIQVQNVALNHGTKLLDTQAVGLWTLTLQLTDEEYHLEPVKGQ
jgi:hypothetical protein